MNRPVKIVLFLLASLLFAHPFTASAAEQKDVNEILLLIREAASDKENPSFFISYMGFDYTLRVTLADGKPEKMEVIAETFYGSKEDFKTYIIGDSNLDGEIDYAIYKQGGTVKGTFNKQKETGKDIRSDAQSLYDCSISFSLRKLNKK